MRLAGEFLLVLPAVGIVIATLPLAARLGRARPWLYAIAALASVLPLVTLARPEAARSVGRALWEVSTIGGPTAHAAYHIDALALIGAAVAALVSAAALARIGEARARRPALPALVVAQGLALLALAAVTDLVAAGLVAGTVAALTAAIGFLVAPAAAAARLAALLALGVQSFIATALLVARFGIASFDLDAVPSAAIGPDVLATMALGAALFCGLYPFVPWRYEAPRSAPSGPPRAPPDPAAVPTSGTGRDALPALRGALIFPTGVAGSILALRVVGAADGAPSSFTLPAASDTARLLVAAVVVLVAFFGAVVPMLRRGRREAAFARLGVALAVLAFIAAYPALRWSHAVALLALASVAYASVASAAHPAEWAVARFDARLGTLWAAVALGTPTAVAGGLFALLASAAALALEAAPLRGDVARHARAIARILVVLGPFAALAGIRESEDLGLVTLCGATLLWAGLVEAGHAVRETRAEGIVPRRRRAFDALAAYAAALGLALIGGAAMVLATRDIVGTTLSEEALPALAVALAFAAVLAAVLPEVPARLSRVPAALVRRALAAADPVPAAVLAYRSIEALSSRVAASFAVIEERAGVWLATLLIALALLWAATS